jgi:hypothetical protein
MLGVGSLLCRDKPQLLPQGSDGACAGDDPVEFGGIQRRSAAESALYGLRL